MHRASSPFLCFLAAENVSALHVCLSTGIITQKVVFSETYDTELVVLRTGSRLDQNQWIDHVASVRKGIRRLY